MLWIFIFIVFKICHFRGKIEFIFGENHNFNALYLLFKNEITAGRLKCCGMEDRTVVAHGYRKTKKLTCGMEGENVVVYGRLPSPALYRHDNMAITRRILNKD